MTKKGREACSVAKDCESGGGAKRCESDSGAKAALL
jgi:hypothetical protein